MYKGLALGHGSRHTRTVSDGSAPKANDPLLSSWASQDYRDKRFFEELEEREAKIDSRAPRTFDDTESSDDEENWDEDPELEKLSTAIYRETLANLKSANFYERRTMLQHIESMQRDSLLSKSQAKQFKLELDDAFSAIEKAPTRKKASVRTKLKTTYWTLPESGISGSLRDQLRQRDPKRVQSEQEELALRAEHSKRLLLLNDQRKWQMIRLASLIKSLRILASLAAAKAKVKKEAPKQTTTQSNIARSKTLVTASLRTAIPKAKSPTSIGNGANSSTSPTSQLQKAQSKSTIIRNPKKLERESTLSHAGSLATFSRGNNSVLSSKSVQFSRQIGLSTSLLPSLPVATVLSARSSAASDLSQQSSPRTVIRPVHKSQSQESLGSDSVTSEQNSETSSQHSTETDEASQKEQNSSLNSFDALDYEILRFETREGWTDQDFDTDSHLVDFGSLSVASTNVPYQVLELRKIQSSDDDDFSDDEEEEESDLESTSGSRKMKTVDPYSSTSPKSSVTNSKKTSQRTPEKSITKRSSEVKDASTSQAARSQNEKSRKPSISGQSIVKSALKSIKRDLRKGTDEGSPEDGDSVDIKHKVKRRSKSGVVTVIGQQDPFEGAWKIPMGELGENARADRRKQEELKESQVEKAIRNLSLRIEEIEKKREELVSKNPNLASTKARHDIEIDAELNTYQTKISERNKIFGKSDDVNFEYVSAEPLRQQPQQPQQINVDQVIPSFVDSRSAQTWSKNFLPSLPDPKIETTNSNAPVNDRGIPDLSWGKFVSKK